MKPAFQVIEERGDIPSREIESALSRSGDPILIRNGRYLESRYNPVREAEKRLAACDLTGKQSVILFGDGCCYLAELLAKQPGLQVVVIEPDPALAAALLKLRKRGPLSGFSLLFSDSLQSAVDIAAALPPLDTALILEHSPTVQDFPAERKRMADLLKESLQRAAADLTTGRWFERRWLFNILSNLQLQRYHRLLPVEAGDVVIAVPGPTLFESCTLLQENRERFCLIAVAPALPSVRNMGLIPDLVCATDGGYPNLLHFCEEGLSQVPLVFPLLLYRGIRRLWQGPLVPVSSGTALEKTLLRQDLLPVFPESPTVAVFALQLAVSLGGSRIFLAGQDFSFKGLRYHAPGYRFDEARYYSSCRRAPAEAYFVAPPAAVAKIKGEFRMDGKMELYRNAFLECTQGLSLLAFHPSPFLEVPAAGVALPKAALRFNCLSVEEKLSRSDAVRRILTALPVAEAAGEAAVDLSSVSGLEFCLDMLCPGQEKRVSGVNFNRFFAHLQALV